MKNLKILQLFSRYLQYGGEEGSVYRIGDALAEKYQIEYFIASSEQLAAKNRALQLAMVYRNREVLHRLEKYQKIGRFNCWQIHNVFPAISPGAYTLAKRLEVPIIHYLHNYRMGCVNGFWFTQGKECQKCSSGSYVHGVTGKCWRDSYSQSAAMALLLTDTRRRGLFQQVRRWVAISHSQKEAHIRMGIDGDKIDVVHHFLEQNQPDSIPVFPENGYALFIGRLSAEKGVGHLLDAWALLGKNRRLVIAGDGPESQKLQEKASHLGLNNVTFSGFVKHSEQKNLWAGAAFSVVPSIWQEPFGMVVLEAWAQARPVVAHRIGALPELISDGVNGFLADSRDIHDLASVLETSFKAGYQLKEMGRNGLGTLKSNHNKSVWLENMERVYRNANLV
ncbi:MAG: glycosyltransferase family 4 protein [Akkermansiaceae bacterium]|nr:glycosyltransferase family 4 protein [Akkermansiaceae bacterium]